MINIFIFDKPFGMSTRISLNSFIKGGNTRIKIVNIITDVIKITANLKYDELLNLDNILLLFRIS